MLRSKFKGVVRVWLTTRRSNFSYPNFAYPKAEVLDN